MAEDDIVELLLKRGEFVRSSETQTHPSDPPTILRGSGSGGGGGEGDAPLPLQPSPQHLLFIQEDEMATWLYHPPVQDYFRSELLYSGPATQPPISVSLAPPPPPYIPYGQVFSGRRAENFMNFLSLRENIRAEAGPSTPVVRETLQVVSSATPSSSAAELRVIPATATVSSTFVVPCLNWKDMIAGTPSSEVPNAGTRPLQIQPATEMAPAVDRNRGERVEPIVEPQENRAACGSKSKKRSRAIEIHNLSERKRRGKINENMKTLQEIIPRCTKTDKASVLDDAIGYVKWLENQIQIISARTGMMPMMYPPNTQPFMPMGRMDTNQSPFVPFPGAPSPRQAHMAGAGPSYPPPRYPLSVGPSGVHLPSSQPNLVSSQPQFPAYMNPNSQFPGRPQMPPPPPPPFQTQTTSQLRLSQASSSKEPKDQGNQPKVSESGT